VKTGTIYILTNKENISLSKKGNTAWLGKKHTEEAKRKMSEIKKGSHLTEETKQKISKTLKEKYYKKKESLCY